MKESASSSLIIGGGPAGYTAGIYLARYGRAPVIVRGPEPGGQLMVTADVENFPGFRNPIQGPWLMEECAAQAQAYGAQMDDDTIVQVNFEKSPFVCQGKRTRYLCKTVIIATGAATRWLGLEREAFFLGHGVSSCATCDGRLYKDKDVVVVGGGNTAAEEGLFLAQHARSVLIVHRRDFLRADKILRDRLYTHPKIRFLWNHVIHDIKGTEAPKAVTSVVVRHVETGVLRTLKVRGVFIAIGHTPNTNIFQPWLPIDQDGYLLGATQGTMQSTATKIPGIFIAGDVQDRIYRQAITAAGQGCMAAMDAERFLQSQ